MWKVDYVRGRLVKTSQQSKISFVQFTMRIRTQQRFAAFSRQGVLLAGDPERELDVVDYWVFERRVHDNIQGQQMDVKDGAWRLAGRLAIPNDGW